MKKACTCSVYNVAAGGKTTYVGMTCRKPDARFAEHRRSSGVVTKDCTCAVVQSGLSRKAAFKLERKLITKCRADGFCRHNKR